MTQLQLHQAESQVIFYSWSTRRFVFFLILPNPVLCSNNFFPQLEKCENLARLESLCAHSYIKGGMFWISHAEVDCTS